MLKENKSNTKTLNMYNYVFLDQVIKVDRYQ